MNKKKYIIIVCILSFIYIISFLILPGVVSADRTWDCIWEPEYSNDLKYIKDAIFWNDKLFASISSSEDLNDPNEIDSLWYASSISDPNEKWELKSLVNDKSHSIKIIDTLFSDKNFLYLCIADSNSISSNRYENKLNLLKINKTLDIAEFTKNFPFDKYGVEYKGKANIGAVYNDYLFIGAIVENDKSMLLKCSLSSSFLDEDPNINIQDPNINTIDFFKVIDNNLYIGIGTTDAKAKSFLYYTSDGSAWNDISIDNDNVKIMEYISLVKAGNFFWLFCRCSDDSNLVEYKIFKSIPSLLYDQEQKNLSWTETDWEMPVDINDPNQDIGLYSKDEYLYLWVSSDSSNESSVWKSYQATTSFNIFNSFPDPNAKVTGLFIDTNDKDHIYTDVQTTDDDKKYIKFYKHFVPRVDLDISWDKRFYKNKESKFNMEGLSANFENLTQILDENYITGYQGKGDTITSSLSKDLNSAIIDTNNYIAQVNFTNGEGIYTVKFGYRYKYGEIEEEPIYKHVLLCYDINAPQIPDVDTVAQEGNQHLVISWDKSTDSLELDPNSPLFEDPNFHKSLLEYEINFQKKELNWVDPNNENYESISYTAYYDGNKIQREQYKYDIKNLENDVEYKVRIRAKDKAGNISGWSEDIEGSPFKPLGITDLSNEKSKCFINLLEDKKKENKINKKHSWIFSVKGGYIDFKDDTVNMIYDKDNSYGGKLEIGYMPWCWLENSLDCGYCQMSGYGLDPNSLEPTIDKFYFRIIPISLTAKVLLFPKKNYIVQPYMGIGFDLWLYQEDNGLSTFNSYKTGYHGVFAIRFLLDKFDRREATLLFDNYGIKHTYFTIEAVWNKIDNFSDNNLDLSGYSYFIGTELLF